MATIITGFFQNASANLDQTALNASDTTDTLDLAANGWTKMSWHIDLKRSTAGDVQLTFEASPDNTRWYYYDTVSWLDLSEDTYESRTILVDRFSRYFRFTSDVNITIRAQYQGEY